MALKKTLVLCIDRDDDLGKKAKVKGPVIGEKKCLEAAQALGVVDPADSDVNAIYESVKNYKELKKEGKVEVAVITGHKNRGSLADRNVTEQLEKIIAKEKITEIVFVSDGSDDEQLLPIIQSRIKIASVKTVIVKQTKELEKSYYVIKELLRDPHFSRIIFGLPGIIIAIYGLVNLFGIQELSLHVSLGLVGLYLILKGFGIEDAVVSGFNSFIKSMSIEKASFPLYMASLIILLLGIWSGVDNISFVWQNIPNYEAIAPGTGNIISMAAFTSGFIGLLTLAIVLYLAGRLGDSYYKKEAYKMKKFGRSIISIISLFIIVESVTKFALFWTNTIATGPEFSDLFVSVGLAFIVNLVGFMVVNWLYVTKHISKVVKKGMNVKNIDGLELGTITNVNHKEKMFHFEHNKQKKWANFSNVVLVKENVIIN